ncbi:MAG: LptF/LptG family permease [Polaribacter sp.]|nr:LptF/LptG family permease [Polaribacter sp.]MDG1953915.1 LptF/LptG family permease [Polaribacter sp.]MDG2074529.1 LptF/LptG family permease [Polaribacter sp.]
MKIIDAYILKKFLTTFFFTLLILIPIAVAIDIAEKVDKFLNSDTLTLFEIVNDYYKNFIIYYLNTFMPLAVFIAVIVFTSKLSNDTEIVAINNAKVSFTRFLYPYFVGATLITIFALVMNHFVVPSSSKVRKKFENTYIFKPKYAENIVKNFSLQLTDSTYIFIQSFDLKRNTGYNFSTDVYKDDKIKSKLTANDFSWNPKDSTFKLFKYKIRRVFKDRDSILLGNSIDTTFAFSPKDLVYKSSLAQQMPSNELIDFINISKKRGVKNLNAHLVELHKRTSLPIASYFLTIIAVALAFKKRRGGTGVNLAVGFGLMFVYIFFLKVSEVLGAVAGANSMLTVWIPNMVFGALALYLYYNGRK